MKHRPPRVLFLLVALGFSGAALAAGPGTRSPAPAVVETQGAIPRATFDTWLARGPQYLLSQVVPIAVTRDRTFLGFRLSTWFPGHPDVAQGAVRQGDVVVRVNGRSVERPDQFLVVWKQLQGVSSVVIEGARHGAPLKATLVIVDPPPVEGPTHPEPTPGTP